MSFWSRIGILAATIAGLAVAVWTIGNVGLTQIVQTARHMGTGGFAAICAWSLGTSALLGGAWHAAAPGEPGSRMPLFTWARMVRDAVSNLLPFSELGGILVGVRTLVAGGVSTSRAYGSLVVDMTTEMASQLVYTLFALIALAPLMMGGRANGHLLPAIAGGTAVMVGFILLFFFMQRSALDFATRIAGHFLPESNVIADVRAELSRIYSRRGHVLAAFGFNLAGWIASGAGAWLVLWLMDIDIALWRVLALEGLIFTLRSVAFVVPGAIGVQEAGYALVAPIFNLAPEAALALSFAKRAREIMISVTTLLVWQINESRSVIARS